MKDTTFDKYTCTYVKKGKQMQLIKKQHLKKNEFQ